MEGRTSFLLYTKYAEHLQYLSDEDCGALFKAIFAYVSTGAQPELSPAAFMAFSFIKAQIDQDAEKYNAKCSVNAANGARGGRPKKTGAKAEANEENQEKAEETEKSERFPEKPNGSTEKRKNHDNEYDNDSDSDNEEYKEPPISPPGDNDGKAAGKNLQGDRFAAFWQMYPKKVAKGYAEKAWKRLKPTEEIFIKIMDALERQRRSDQWCRDGGRYVPNPATWLNGKYWEDGDVDYDRNRSNLGQNIKGDDLLRGFHPAQLDS